MGVAEEDGTENDEVFKALQSFRRGLLSHEEHVDKLRVVRDRKQAFLNSLQESIEGARKRAFGIFVHSDTLLRHSSRTEEQQA